MSTSKSWWTPSVGAAMKCWLWVPQNRIHREHWLKEQFDGFCRLQSPSWLSWRTTDLSFDACRELRLFPARHSV